MTKIRSTTKNCMTCYLIKQNCVETLSQHAQTLEKKAAFSSFTWNFGNPSTKTTEKRDSWTINQAEWLLSPSSLLLFIPSVVKIPWVKSKSLKQKLEWSLVVVAGKAVVQQDGVEALNSDWNALNKNAGLPIVSWDRCDLSAQLGKEYYYYFYFYTPGSKETWG